MYHYKEETEYSILSINFLLLSFSLIFAVLLIWLLSFSERWLSFDSKLEFHVISPALAIPNVPANNTLPSPIENHPPVANAGKNQTVNENATVTLNGITTESRPK